MSELNRIYEALLEVDCEWLFGAEDVKDKSAEYQSELENLISKRDYENVVADISQYGIACGKTGFIEGFRMAWKLHSEIA